MISKDRRRHNRLPEKDEDYNRMYLIVYTVAAVIFWVVLLAWSFWPWQG